MKKIVFTLLLSVILVTASFGSARAISDGYPDGEGHPYVGLLVFDVNGSPAWRCSGTLISPTVMVTAGHCTFESSGGRVWFESDVQSQVPYPDYPFGGATSIEFSDIYTHPDFTDATWFMHDVGVVILSSPVVLPEYGQLPTVDQLDSLHPQRGLKNTFFTAVGYGLQKSFPDAASWKDSAMRVRMVANPQLIQINVPGFTGDFSLLLSNNTNTGGTCFGDSGGPNFLGDSTTIAGVTSFGMNSTCGGTGGVFRLDRQNVLDFINSHLP